MPVVYEELAELQWKTYLALMPKESEATGPKMVMEKSVQHSPKAVVKYKPRQEAQYEQMERA